MLVFSMAYADSRSSALLERLRVVVMQMPSYEVSFEVTGSGMPAVHGRYVVSGSRYYINSGEVEVVCDGKVRYEISHPDREISVDKVDPAQKSILSNPSRAFDFLDGSFTHTYKGEESLKGKKCVVVELKPADKSQEFMSLLVYVDPSTGLPQNLRYTLDGREYIDVYIVKITESASVDESLFKLGKTRYKGYDTVDFR